MTLLDKICNGLKGTVDNVVEKNKAVAVKNRLKMVLASKNEEMDSLYIKIGKMCYQKNIAIENDDIAKIYEKLNECDKACEVTESKIRSVDHYIKYGMPTSSKYVSDLLELDEEQEMVEEIQIEEEKPVGENLTFIDTDVITVDDEPAFDESSYIKITETPLQTNADDIMVSAIDEETVENVDDDIDYFQSLKEVLAKEEKKED